MTVQEGEEGYDGPVCYHNLKNRPRSCTDVGCCFIFLIFLVFIVIAGIVAVIFGAPLRLLHGHDSFGNICGSTNMRISDRTFTGMDMTSKPHVFFFDIWNPRDCLKICVSRCPDRSLSTLLELERYAQGGNAALCRYDLPTSYYSKSDSASLTKEECAGLRKDGNAVEVLVDYGEDGCLVKINQWREGYGTCPRLPVNPSSPVLNRCLPDKSDAIGGIIFDFYGYLNTYDFFSQVMADLYASHREIVGLSVAAMLLSGVYLGILYFATAAVVYVVLVLVTVSSVVGTALIWWAWASQKELFDSRLHFGQYDVLVEETKHEILLLIFAIGATLMTVVIFALLIFTRPRTQTNDMIRMFEEATTLIRKIPWLMAQPVWTFLALSLFFMIWSVLMICFATSEIPRFVRRQITIDHLSSKVVLPDTSFTVIDYDISSPVRFLWIYYVFALIWISEFILACQQMVIAGAISMWYFERNKTRCSHPILSSIRQMLIYHIGSVALGSLLITLFKIPRLITLQLKRLSKQQKNWWIYDNFLIYINHNAYAIIAVQGTNFFPAAAEAQQLLSENAMPMIGVNRLGDFIFFLGKCSVTAIVAILGIISMKYDPQLHLYAIPLLLCFVFAYFISHCVLSLYEISVDTIFLCYCEDIRIQEECWSGTDVVDKPSADPYFASPSLRDFMRSRTLKVHQPALLRTAEDVA